MKISVEISNKYLEEIMPFLPQRQLKGHLKIAKKCLKEAVEEVLYSQLEIGHDLSASALEKYLREMKSEYIRLKESELGYKLERENFIEILDKNRNK